MNKILVINGPNINLLGKREKDIYGEISYNELCDLIKEECDKLNLNVEIFQSNYEGEIIDKIHKSIEVDFIIANLGAYTHTSIAIRDALLGVDIPFIEVHLSNVFKREDFRKKSYFSDISEGIIIGFGYYSYILAIYAAKRILS